MELVWEDDLGIWLGEVWYHAWILILKNYKFGIVNCRLSLKGIGCTLPCWWYLIQRKYEEKGELNKLLIENILFVS